MFELNRKTLSVLLAIALVVGAMQSVPEAGAQTPQTKAATVDAREAREGKARRDRRMAWWRNARFGMFIHWGLYAVPAGEYKGQKIGGIGEWIMDTAKIPIPEYEKFAPQFNPVQFNAREWVRVAKAAGMQYMVITSKHHEGFSMFGTKTNAYNIVQATPFKRDPLKELSRACREAGIKFGVYYSIMDWHHPDANEAGAERYIAQMKQQLRELVTGYDLSLLWFDGEWVGWWNEARGRDLEAYVRGLKPNIVINNRIGKRQMQDGDYETPEQEIPATSLNTDWETCMTMNDTWGFKTDDRNWKSTPDLLHKLADIAGKGGNFLLNVGPTKEGLIPQPSIERLTQMGRWLRANGESIYGTSAGPWRNLPWGRVTARPGRLYLRVFDWPRDGRLLVPGLQSPVSGARLLTGDKRMLGVARSADGVLIALPPRAPDALDSVIVLDIKGTPAVMPTAMRQTADGVLTLRAADAEIHGQTARYESGGGKDNIGFWSDVRDQISWNAEIKQPGTFTVEITYSCLADNAGSEFAVEAAGQTLTGQVASTGSWTTFETKTLGTVKVDTAGRFTLWVKPLRKPGYAVMNLESVTLRPVPN